MASSTGPILAIGGVTFANRVIAHGAAPDWKLPLATGLLALLAAGAERLNAPLVTGIAWIGLVTTLFVPSGGYPAPLVTMASISGVDVTKYGLSNNPKGGNR